MNESLQKLLDNGWGVTFFRTGPGNYTARAIKNFKDGPHSIIASHTIPEAALAALADKVVWIGKYQE